MALATQPERTLLADQLRRAFHGGAWHGPALFEAVAGVDAETARWRPGDGFHCIAELVGHLTFWMEDTAFRIGGGRRDPLDDGSDWPAGTASTEADWQRALAAFEQAQSRLAAAVEALEDAALDAPVPGAEPTRRSLLLGILQHNAYHGGQVALLRRQAQAARGGP